MENSKVSTISHAKTLEEMAEFWDVHNLADYHDQTYEVEMTFDPSARRTVVAIEPELMDELVHIAHVRRISVQTLINVWLRQNVDRLTAAAVS